MRTKTEIPAVSVPVDVFLEMARLYSEGLARRLAAGDHSLKHVQEVKLFEQRSYRKLVQHRKGQGVNYES